MSESPHPAWTVRQLAEYLSVNQRTVYRMAERGELPAFKVGDAWRFRRHDIDEWIERQQQERGGNVTSTRRRRSKS
ncbi:MAG: helix-turn-helix domain-containing protein [Candidatus Rokubacteria bacterium]|nr:helix-turn-helix domain-containing protein [Candidatus Rokubacteria bacterium]